jgi:D-aminopeptidase
MPTGRGRARSYGIGPGFFPPGPENAITDVAGVLVGHVTRVEGTDIRTGATAIVPHGGNLWVDRVPAGFAVANGFGKMTGTTQVVELGEIETAILLTNTFAVPRALEAILDWTLAQPGSEGARSINAVVGETNDGYLNAIEKRPLSVADLRRCIEGARTGAVEEGCVGAGTGTIALGWKAGIGTASRALPEALGGHTLGVLVQANFGGELRVCGIPVGRLLGRCHLPWDTANSPDARLGSIMIVVAIDAPLSDRNLTRLARRTFAGMAKTGASMSNGSGDYAIAFTTAGTCRRTACWRDGVTSVHDLGNDRVSPLFQAAAEATEEAIYNALFAAETMTGRDGRIAPALPLDDVRALLAAPKERT